MIADRTRLTRPAYHQTWYAKKAPGGGGHLIWLGIHWLDLAMYLSGSDVVEVAGFTGIVGGQPLDVEDSAPIAMKFSNGAFGTMTSGYYLDRAYHSHMKIWGSHGWLEIRRRSGLPLSWYSRRELNPQVHQIEKFAGSSGYTPFVRACVRESAGLEEPPLTADESLRVLKTVYGCYQAAETGSVERVG